MINLTKKLIIIKQNNELALHALEALDLISKNLTTNKNFRTALKKIIQLFNNHTHEEVTEVLSEWYNFISYKNGASHHTQLKRKRTYLSTLTATDIKPAKTILRIIFVYLHKSKTVILSHNFTRPIGSITALPELQKNFYSETIHPFLDLETNSPAKLLNEEREYTPAQRLWQTGIKSLLMSTFFTPEDINTKDIQSLRLAQLKTKQNQILPIPTTEIIDTICKYFPNRTPAEVNFWLEQALTVKEQAAVQHGSCEAIITEALENHNDPIKVTMTLSSYRRYGVSSFSCESVADYKLDNNVHRDKKIFIAASKIWIAAEQAFVKYLSPEKAKSIRLALGKINLYLFVYLPLWLSHNPHSKFQYPGTPAEFTGTVHYDCEAPYSSDRPLSMCELFRTLNYSETHGTQSVIRSFFKFLIDFGSDLKGCTGVKQPVTKTPKSKKYYNVTKNVFTGDQLRLFIAYHHALNSAADYYLENSTRCMAIVNKAQKNKTHVDTAALGFVPVIYLNGRVTYIRRLHPSSFHFVIHDHTPYYNPGCVSFSLFLLECGVRGQTLQWLDAETYDRTSQRLSSDSLQLTTLWLNTDKIQKTPIIILTTMGNLHLLDEQRYWRKLMIEEVGITSFTKKIFYDNQPDSHWGKILPLFAADVLTGEPFTDYQYSELWKHHCLNFQTWLRDNTTEKSPLVGFLPLRNNSSKTPFTWEEWVRGISSDEILVLHGSPTNKVYIGDYTPVSLRAYATPHGARASFVTDMSSYLPPDAVALLTGQSISTIIRYNKGHELLQSRLKGVFNNKDASWFLTNPFDPTFSMREARDRIEDSNRQGTLSSTIDKLGLNSFPTSSSPREMTGLKLIATDKSLSLGACYTHICPYNFICPEHILQKFEGQKRCAQCPFSVFSTHNLPAIEAHRQKMAEEYLRICKTVERYTAGNEVSTAEKSRLQGEIKNSAKEVISWMLVEEVLWAKVELQQESTREEKNRDLITNDRKTIESEIVRTEYNHASVEGFLSRLDSACTYPDSISRNFEYKIDRATRLLMINDENTLGAAMMPSSYPSAVKLAGMIRSNLEFDKINIEQFVGLINLDDSDWEQALLSYRPTHK
ncbi:hypothetical protein QCL51_07165 [Pseudomonas sp. LTR0]|uniref:hypothetical protein n=1 Tax=Pseudomonas sp. LTR0 TaxID=3040601 RepID=UPI0030CC7035